MLITGADRRKRCISFLRANITISQANQCRAKRSASHTSMNLPFIMQATFIIVFVGHNDEMWVWGMGQPKYFNSKPVLFPEASSPRTSHGQRVGSASGAGKVSTLHYKMPWKCKFALFVAPPANERSSVTVHQFHHRHNVFPSKKKKKKS